ncbi:transposase [Eubacteriales bacterium OttesenSCG-928-N13]|nr:transposase [Eubacteriales bacterium OttesenSCG-928-N13]
MDRCLVAYLRKILLASDVLHSDETPVNVLDEKNRVNSQMWVYRTGACEAHPIVIYDYQPSREARHPKRFLDGFTGYLVAKDRKDTILFNDHLRVENVPATAYEYVVNGRSAIEWIMERYQIRTNKDSGIVNDPNLWCDEHHNPEYILNLLLSVIAVSVQTVEIVRGLPKVIE